MNVIDQNVLALIKGDTGESALIGFSTIIPKNLNIGETGTIQWGNSDTNKIFNRMPKVGELCTINFCVSQFAEEKPNATYIATIEIETASGDINNGSVEYLIKDLHEIIGATGESSLNYNTIYTAFSEPKINTIYSDLSIKNFNREPNILEKFNLFIIYMRSGKPNNYLAWVTVSSITGNSVTVRIEFVYTLNGEQGDTGLNYLYLKETVTNGNIYPITLTENISKFNRTPLLDDYCIVLYNSSSTADTYMCNYQVTNIDNDNVTLSVIDYIKTKGQKGENGKNALTTNSIFESNTDPTIGGTVSFVYDQFNRNPQSGDTLTCVFRNSEKSKTFIVNAEYSGSNSPQYNFTITSFADITGLQGPRGPQGDGTLVNINEVPVYSLDFVSDPQTQINNCAKNNQTNNFTCDQSIINGFGLVLMPASPGQTYNKFKIYADGDHIFIEKTKVSGGSDYEQLI